MFSIASSIIIQFVCNSKCLRLKVTCASCLAPCWCLCLWPCVASGCLALQNVHADMISIIFMYHLLDFFTCSVTDTSKVYGK